MNTDQMISITAATLTAWELPVATTTDGSLCLSGQGLAALRSGYYPLCHLPAAVAYTTTTIRHHVAVDGNPHSLEVFVDIVADRAAFEAERQRVVDEKYEADRQAKIAARAAAKAAR